MKDSALEITNLTKNFNFFNLGPININVPKGVIVGLIGKNGSGKSTLIKLILGLINKNSGEINILGQNNYKNDEIKEDIGFVFDDLFFPETLNIKNIMSFCSNIYKKWDNEKFCKLIKSFDLPDNLAIKNFSRGMKMKLSMAICLSHNAKILFLDEATSGLDPVIRDEILDLLLEFMQDENHTIIISSHILSDLEKISDHLLFIDDGKILFFEEKDKLIEDYLVYSLDHDEIDSIDEKQIIGRRKNNFGEEILVKKDVLLENKLARNPSIEEIMIYFIKGAKNND